MFENKEFAALVSDGNPTGEVVAVDRFIVTAAGLDGVPISSLVMFEDGSIGMVREIGPKQVMVLNLTSETTQIGTLLVFKSPVLAVSVGRKQVGRVIDPLGRPIDGGGMIKTESAAEIFAPAPSLVNRSILNTQLESGVGIVDTLFPVVLGQRIAVMGDSKSGKTTFLTQLAMRQASLGRIIVYVLIAPRKADLDLLVARLRAADIMDRVLLVVSSIHSALPLTYIAPYSACAMAEYLWQSGEDVVVIYDDLSSHAKAYRELSLLLRSNPGRESYPGDMFFAHSSLLERAGKLKSNQKTLTALPVAVTPNDDITGYLSTSLISITDGQLIFDLTTMHQGIKPAVNAGLSVSRVGGRAQAAAHKKLSHMVSEKLASYRRAKEYAQFSSEMALSTQKDIAIGQRLYQVFSQTPDELYTIAEQQIMLWAVMLSQEEKDFSVSWLKQIVRDVNKNLKAGADFQKIAEQIIKSNPIVMTK